LNEFYKFHQKGQSADREKRESEFVHPA
jgi:hypothetical protein